jgi:tetratricopeptide (TPR) repeat protein
MAAQLSEVLVERLRSGRCVLCAGADLRALAGMPNWSGILERLTDRSSEPVERKEELRRLIRDGRLFLAAGYLERKLGPAGFAGAVREALASPAELPEVLRLLGELPFRTIVSTGSDDLLERAFERDGVRPNVCTLADGRDLKREARGRLLLKVMGDVSRPETICRTARDFERALASSPGYQGFGEEMALSRTLLFVGFAPEDPDFQLLLERFFAHAGDAEHEHFALLPSTGEVAAEELYERYRLRVIADAEAAAFVRELRAQVGELRRAVIDEDDLEGYLRWLAIEPDSADARDGLFQLEARAREAGEWERVVEVLLGRVENAEPGAVRAELLGNLAQVFEDRLGDLPKAFTALAAALREEPDRPERLRDLERLATAADHWNELIAEYAQLAQATDDPLRWLQLGRWYLDRVHHVDYAITAARQAAQKIGVAGDAGELLAEALRVAERWPELAELLGERAQHTTDPARKGELLLGLADVFETRVGDVDKAVSIYRRAAELEGGGDALAQLERIFRRRERWRELCDLLARRVELCDDPAAARAMRREIGEILADRLGDDHAAIARLEGVVAEDPQSTAALRALERIYERANRTGDYLRTLERLSEAVTSIEERVMLLRRLAAEWEEREGGKERAAVCLEAVLSARPRDEEALRGLERLLRQTGRFPRLCEVLERHAEMVTDTNMRADLYGQIGRLYEDELRDLPRATAAFVKVQELGGEADGDLGRIYLKTGEWQKAYDVLPRVAERAEAGAKRAELWHTAGKLAAEKIHDDAAAESCFAKALETDASCLPAMVALAEVYEKRGDWLRAARLKSEAVERTGNRLDKTRLTYEAARLYEERLADEGRAQELYARALALDPEHAPAAARVAELYERAGRLPELEPVLDLLLRKAERAEVGAFVDVAGRVARLAEQMGNQEKAIKAYRQALEVDPTALPPLAGLANLLYRSGDHEEAQALSKALLERHGATLPAGERLELWFRLAEIASERDELDRAADLYEQVLTIDAGHAKALEALAALDLERGHFKETIVRKQALAKLAAPEERARLHEEIGDLQIAKLENPVAAVQSYQAALELRPDRAILLHKVLGLHTEQKQWRPAVEVIGKLIELERDPARRAKYSYAAAAIYRDELGDEDRAIELYDAVLEDAPDTQAAFENIEEIYQKREDWKALERAYRRMIKRLPAEGMNDIRLRLWSNLGEVALGKLGNREVALAALEVASSLDEDNVARREQLSELYIEAGPDYADKAIEEQQWLIRRQPDRLAAYQRLRKLYGDTQQTDKVWCLCAALKFLKRATPDELELYERLKPQKFTPGKRRLSEEAFTKHLMHPDEDRLVNAIFSLVGPAVAGWSAQPHKAFGLVRKDRTDPAQHEHMAARAFRYAVETLGITAPDLYLRPEQTVAIQVANAIEKDKLVPAFIVGAALLEKPREKDLVVEISKRLVYLRPERYVRYVLPSAQGLSAAVRAGLSASGVPGGPVVDGETNKIVDHLKRVLPRAALEQLGHVGRKLLEAKGPLVDLSGWLAASDLTANRTAFALVNDFEAAARMVSTEQGGLSPLAAKDRLKDLLGFSVSEEYFAVRKQLGLEVRA